MRGRCAPEDAFDVAAMATWLAAHGDPARAGVDLSAVPEVRQFSGGASNLTYLLRYPDGDLILRRPPKGAHSGSAHDMSREHRIPVADPVGDPEAFRDLRAHRSLGEATEAPTSTPECACPRVP